MTTDLGKPRLGKKNLFVCLLTQHNTEYLKMEPPLPWREACDSPAEPGKVANNFVSSHSLTINGKETALFFRTWRILTSYCVSARASKMLITSSALTKLN